MQDEVSKYSELGDNAQKYAIAIKYTNGDDEKARQMIAGAYKDVDVIKGRFAIDSADVYGIFMIFMNNPYSYIMNIGMLIFQENEVYEKARVFDAWKSYYSYCESSARKGSVLDTSELTSHTIDSIEGYDLFSDIKDENYVGASDTLTEILKKFYNLDNIIVQMEVEKASSLEMATEKVPIDEPGSASGGSPEDGEDDSVPQIEKDATYLMESRVIVSPVRGKYVNDIEVGDVIKVLPEKRNDLSLKVAKSLNALDEEREFLPMNARVKEKIPLPKSGYTIYCLVAKNVVAKIIEEENVKIETSESQQKKNKNAQPVADTGRNVPLFLALVIGLILLSVLIVYVLV